MPSGPISDGDSGKNQLNPHVINNQGLVADIYQNSGASRFGISSDEFARILSEIATKNLSHIEDEKKARDFFSGLHVEELALARACAAGSDAAWETFLTRYRVALYDMAQSIARDESIARDLADNIFADLYGSEGSGTQRVSKLASYTGCGSLLGWMRAVMSRAFINIYRSGRRMVSLEEQEAAGELPTQPKEENVPVDGRLERATGEAIAALTGEDRFLLASYFLDGRTLAEVARTLGMHESTASRRLEKITSGLRKKIRDNMIRQGMSRAQAEEALEADVRDVQLDIRTKLKENLQETPAKPFSKRKAGGNTTGGDS